MTILPEHPTVKAAYTARAVAKLVDIQSTATTPSECDLLGDVFLSLYDNTAVPTADDSVTTSRPVNQMLTSYLHQQDQLATLRQSTSDNICQSMATAPLIHAHLLNDETIADAMKAQEKIAEAKKTIATLSLTADVYERMAQTDAKFADMAQASRKRVEELEGDVAELTATAVASVAKFVGNEFKQAGLSAALSSTRQTADNIESDMAGWGMGSGSLTATSPTAAKEFLKLNMGKVARIAKLAGRMKGLALSGQSQSITGINPNTVQLTQDPSMIFPEELVFLHGQTPAAIRLPVVGQYLDIGLLGFELSADAEQRGPMSIFTDVSPSMHGQRDMVAKGISMGLCLTARDDGREWNMTSFASDPKTMLTVDHKSPFAKLAGWAEFVSGGGTDFDMAVNYAMNMLSKLGQRADLVFISDGEGRVAPETVLAWNKFKESTGARLFYVPVGRSYHKDIENMADVVLNLAELDEHTGGELSNTIGKWMMS